MEYDKVYFIGIGGIGMSALARWFHRNGSAVSGYDRTASALTAELQNEGIDVHYDDDPSKLPSKDENALVIYTPAIPQDLQELRQAFASGLKVVKRSAALGEATRDKDCLAVAGTHGKTTTSSLVAHILVTAGCDPSAFLGGIARNYDTNMLIGSGKAAVAEADEFDRSFLQLHPLIAAITAMDADHLDIYGTLENVQDAYRQFASQVKGTLVLKYGLPVSASQTTAGIVTYSLDRKEADYHAQNISLCKDGHYTFDLVHPTGVIKSVRTGALGRFNIENSVAAAAICLEYGIGADSIREAVGSFKGAHRRLEDHVNTAERVYIDDYAHHPAELEASIRAIREMFPGRHFTGVFQPHLYTRTRDFAEEFASALSLLDTAILLDIYPAREEPLEGVSSKMILDRIGCGQKMLMSKAELMEHIAADRPELLATFGAGDIDRLVFDIADLMK